MTSSILSFPERGPWGDARYPGNCSGHVLQWLIQLYRPRFIVDPMEGSGTSRAVCRRLRLPYVGFDLSSGFDATTVPLVSRLDRRADLVFLHPPYHSMIVYSGNVWGTNPDDHDLSRCGSLLDYEQKLRWVIRSCHDALAPTGHLAVLIGDLRQRGRYVALLPVVLRCLPEELLEAIVIKLQHNVTSDRTTYTGSFIPIRHEYLVIFKSWPALRHD